MAFMTGNDGSCNFNSVEIPIRQWEFTEEATEKEVTNSTTAANAREYLADRAGASGSFEAYVVDTTATITIGTEATLFLVSKQGTADKHWTGTAVILSKNVITQVAGGDAVLVRYGFRFSGAISEQNYSA